MHRETGGVGKPPPEPGRMTFGKFKGRYVTDLPDDYLGWLRTISVREPLATLIEVEWSRRFPPPPNDGRRAFDPDGDAGRVASELVEAGYRALALKWNPDGGGSSGEMVILNLVVDELRKFLRAGKP